MGSESNLSILLSGLIDLLFRDGGLFQSLVDIIGSDFRVFEDDDEVITLKNSCDFLVLGQTFKDLLFNLEKISSALGILLHNDIFSLLLVRHLLNDKLVEHLLLQAKWCDGEVE